MNIKDIETIIKSSCTVSFDDFKHSVHNSPFDTIDVGYIDDLLTELNINLGTKSMKKIMNSNSPSPEQFKVISNTIAYYRNITLSVARSYG